MTDKGLTGYNTENISRMTITFILLELVDNTMLTLEVNEKEQASLGQRIRALGMCFYKRGDLK